MTIAPTVAIENLHGRTEAKQIRKDGKPTVSVAITLTPVQIARFSAGVAIRHYLKQIANPQNFQAKSLTIWPSLDMPQK